MPPDVRFQRVDLDMSARTVKAVMFRRGGDIDGDMKRRAEDVADRARVLAPEGESGRLRRSIDVEQRREGSGRFDLGWEVVADTPYALYVHEGTRPHPIHGNPLLSFFWDRVGARVVFRSVKHPGTTGQPFLADAIREAVR